MSASVSFDFVVRYQEIGLGFAGCSHAGFISLSRTSWFNVLMRRSRSPMQVFGSTGERSAPHRLYTHRRRGSRGSPIATAKPVARSLWGVVFGPTPLTKN